MFHHFLPVLVLMFPPKKTLGVLNFPIPSPGPKGPIQADLQRPQGVKGHKLHGPSGCKDRVFLPSSGVIAMRKYSKSLKSLFMFESLGDFMRFHELLEILDVIDGL